MAFCSSCGTEVSGATLCPKCGAGQGSTASIGGVAAAPTAGLSENVAGLLCYVLGWLTGIIFLLVDKRPFVRFHAAQSIVVFGGLTLLRIALGVMFSVGGLFAFGIGGSLLLLLSLFGFALWILLMIKAFQHELFKLPVAAGIAEGIAGR
jgi:uncharacterized membrane protein